MQNIPNVHEHDRDIPAGKVLIAEYRDLGPDARRPETYILDTKTGWGKVEVQLVARTAGFAIAGSCARWTNGHYAVNWYLDGSRHGSSYRTFDDALAHFNRIPTESAYA